MRQTSIKMKQQERETLLIRDKMLIKRIATLEQNKIREAKEDSERKKYMKMLAASNWAKRNKQKMTEMAVSTKRMEIYIAKLNMESKKKRRRH